MNYTPNVANKTTVQLYTEFKQSFKNRNLEVPIDGNTFSLILRECNKEFEEEIFKNIEGIKLPNDLGFIVVHKYTSTKRLINRELEKLHGIEVPYTNLHSLGYRFKIKWYTFLTRMPYQRIYKFVPCRAMNRKLAKIIKGGFLDYMTITKKEYKELYFSSMTEEMEEKSKRVYNKYIRRKIKQELHDNF